MVVRGLNIIDPSLYQWVDDMEYGRWLREYPDSSSNVMTISHVSRREWEDNKAARQWEPCEVLTEEEWLQRWLTPWVDDVMETDVLVV